MTEPGPDAEPEKRRSAWVWVSAALGVIVVGLLVWVLTTNANLNDTQDELDSTQQELDSAQQSLDAAATALAATPTPTPTASPTPTPTPTPESDDDSSRRRAVLSVGAFATMLAVYNDLADQLGATETDLAQTEQDLEEANQKADQAEQDAKAAEQKAQDADDDADKAQAQSDQVKAQAEAVQSRRQIAADCGRAYISAFGALFEGDDVEAQAPIVRQQIEDISAHCKTAFEGT